MQIWRCVFLRDFRTSSISKVNFSVLTKRLALTVKIIKTLCNFGKMDKMYMLILVSRDL